MKKPFLSFIFTIAIFISSSGISQAMSSLTINEATPAMIRSYLIENMSMLGENVNVETMTDSSITFDLTRTKFKGFANLFVMDAENKITFTFTAAEKGTLLTYNAVGRAHTIYGDEVIAPTSTPYSEKLLLESIKIHFDGGYLYGFVLSPKKKESGFPLISITPNSPMDKAGFKEGDIITKVNGINLKYEKRNGSHNFQTTIYAPTPLTFTVKQGKAEKNIVVTSAFFDPKTKQFAYGD